MLLTISLLAPLLGPLLVAAIARVTALRGLLDGFVIVAIGGLVGAHVLPESIASLGWPAVPAALVGLALPKLLHAHDHPTQKGAASRFLWLLTSAALCLHAVADGIALSVPAAAPHAHHASMPIAVGLHRLLEGMGLWWVMARHAKVAVRLAVLCALACATLAGFAGGQWMVSLGFSQVVLWLQAMVAGSLLHVLLWHAPNDSKACAAPHKPRGTRQVHLGSAVGGVLAACLLVRMNAGHDHGLHEHQAPLLLWPAALQTVSIALVLAALAHALGWPPAWRRARRMPTVWRQAWHGALDGLSQAACSCGVVALAQRRRDKGAGSAETGAFLAAAPSMGWVGLSLSLVMLGPALTLLRGLGVWLMAIVVGVAMRKAQQPQPQASLPAAGGPCVAAHAPIAARLRARLLDGGHFALGEMLDFTGPWVGFGLLLVSVLDAFVPASWVSLPVAWGLDVPVFAALAAPVFLCAGASTLVAAFLWFKGLSAGAVLAFLWMSSTVSFATHGAVRRWYGQSAAAAFVLCCSGIAIGLGCGANALLARSQLLALALWPPSFRGDAQDLSQLGFLGMLALGLAAVTLIRQGVRGVAGQILWANSAQESSGHHHHHATPSAATSPK